MAAEARHYEKKKMTYSSRKIEEKYKQQNRSCDTSPYRHKSRSSSHFSPSRRKRPYSPKSSKQSSLYEGSKKKDRDSDIRQNFQISCDWSKHISSSGKTYYYNRITEQSQWEPPKELLQRERSGSSSQDSRGSRDSRDDEIKDTHNSRYKGSRDNRKSRETKTYSNRMNRDFRNRSGNDYSRSTNLRSDRELNGSISGFKSVGHATPSSKTSSNCNYRTPDSTYINGCLQDISSPDTPTNDDISSILSPVTLCTPLGCSPLLNNSFSNHTLTRSLQSPLLSPNIIAVNSSDASSFLHPLQQALLLKQQVTSMSTPKDLYKSPKLPTVKHLTSSGLSPQISTARKSSKCSYSPNFSSCSTPPPPPPPKENMKESISKSESRAIDNDRNNKQDRFLRSNNFLSKTPELDNRSKNVDYSKNLDYSNNENLSSMSNLNPLRHSDHNSLKSSKYQSNLNPNNSDITPKRHSNSNNSDAPSTRHPNPNNSDVTPKRHTNQNINDVTPKRHTNQNLNDVTPKRHTNQNLNDVTPKRHLNQNSNDVSVKRQTQTNSAKAEVITFSELPSLDKYSQYLSTNKNIETIAESNSGYYGNMLEKQALACCDETQSYLQGDGCRTKFSLIISKLYAEMEDCKSEVNLARLSSLHAVAEKLESLQDLTMNLRTPRENKLINRKKQDSTVSNDIVNKVDISFIKDTTDDKKLYNENGIKIRKIEES
ncbi:GATA zinc finger domain-containing protein 14 isoform X4 [Hydra vulgaris]|uniref:GATA zinc finger domain-containing protein 14 isoform X4 n=1 Tax=Hydra vulgaris TaxID=6087 RepID=A0ABM4C0N7_HYDVU